LPSTSTPPALFYGTTLGCPEGRSSAQWIDFDLFGHQIVAHLKPSSTNGKAHHNPVDGHDVPVPHFGVVLAIEGLEDVGRSSSSRGSGVRHRALRPLQGRGWRAGNHVLFDPAGNALEFKAFADIGQLFAK
jgi:uncharacterized protein